MPLKREALGRDRLLLIPHKHLYLYIILCYITSYEITLIRCLESYHKPYPYRAIFLYGQGYHPAGFRRHKRDECRNTHL